MGFDEFETGWPVALRAVVFDMDGLMFNTEDLYDIVGERLLARRNHTFSVDLKMKMMGRQNLEALTILRDEFGLDEDPLLLAEEAEQIYLELFGTSVKMMPGLIEVLGTIERAGIPKAIATSSSRRLATETLNTFALLPRFEFVITGDDVERGKPDPEIYLAAAERLRLQPAEIMVLEDSVNGSLAASRAGMFTVAVPSRPSAKGDFDHANIMLTALSASFIEKSFGLTR